MSRGSWDYAYRRFEDVADLLKQERDPLRRAFGEQVQKMAEAMKAIEWVDSGDSAAGKELEAIRNALGSRADFAEMAVLVRDGQALIGQLQAVIKRAIL